MALLRSKVWQAGLRWIFTGTAGDGLKREGDGGVFHGGAAGLGLEAEAGEEVTGLSDLCDGGEGGGLLDEEHGVVR